MSILLEHFNLFFPVMVYIAGFVLTCMILWFMENEQLEDHLPRWARENMLKTYFLWPCLWLHLVLHGIEVSFIAFGIWVTRDR